jgi:hypothetical protein
MFKKISNYFYGHIGSFAYFVGTCMADGFRDQMDELDEQEHLATQLADDELPAEKKKDFGAN